MTTPRRRGGRSVADLALLVCALLLSVSGAPASPPADAQSLPSPGQAQKVPADAPPTIPIAEVARRADEVGAVLRSLDEQLASSAQIKRIEQELSPST